MDAWPSAARNLCVALLLASALVRAQESAPASARVLTRLAMESDLDFLASAIREKWSHLEDKSKNFGVDLDALMARARRRLPDTGTKAKFHAILTELVADLKDGHGNVFTLGVPQPSRRWPFTVMEFADGIFVVKATAKAADTIGARWIHDDGVPIETRIAEASRSVFASTPAARRALALNRMLWTTKTIVTATFERPRPAPGQQERISFSFDTLAFEPPELSLFESGPYWSVDRPRPDVARLRVRTFAVDRWTEWLQAKPEERDGFLAETRARIDELFREIAGSKALIIDLRGNGGGTDLLGIHLARHLLPARFVYFKLAAKREGKWRKPHPYDHPPLPRKERFDGPLAVLIDEACFSTTDNFLRALVENRDDVIVVGRPTNGGTGAPTKIAELPNSEAFITLCTQRVEGPKGTYTEGRGTVPTIPVRWTSADWFEKRDPDLAAALTALGFPETRPGK